jgi:hypothetical protein
MDMIEQVERAVYASLKVEGFSHQDFDLLNTFQKTQVNKMARAAIAAMRNCTPAMLDAGSAAHPAGGYVRETLLTDIIEAEWRAMCDAALGLEDSKL